MIAVPQHHTLDIFFRPVRKKPVIIVRLLRDFPTVKSLVHHQHAQAVAGIQKLLRGWVVAGADGIKAIGFHQFDAALFGTVESCSAQNTIVVMHAASTQNNPLAIQQKTFVGRKVQGTNTKLRFIHINHFPIP